MNERNAILARIREALRNPAPVPGHHGHDHAAPATNPEAAISQWLPAVGATYEEQVELFRKNSEELATDFRVVKSRSEVTAQLSEMAISEGWKKVAMHSGELTVAATAIGLPVLTTDTGYDVHELERCDAGISACDALIAQTGSVLVTSRSAGGRALSVLPPHHIVIARRTQLIADLPTAFALLKQKYAPDYPSFISLITGPSRTGDIERILVLGAHGPKKLTIFLCEED